MNFARQAVSSLLLFVLNIQIIAFGAQNLMCDRPELSGRPSSEPYISGDTFRKYCDIIFDEQYENFDPTKVNDGDIIFISQSGDNNRLVKFFSRYHPAIHARYILMTHNSAEAITEKYRQYLNEDKIFLWFAQNIAISHPKLIPIPIGLENAHWGRGYNRLISTLQKQPRDAEHKKYLTILNFTIGTNNQERQPVYNYFHDKTFCYCSGKKKLGLYLQDVCDSKFVLSPHGRGLDCHRTWEALYLGAIPIVKSSSLDKLYEDLPVLIVNDWCEITEEFLEKKYEEMQSQSYNIKKLFLPYWLEIFEAATNDCKKSVEQDSCIDVVIPMCQKDLRTIDYAIEGIRKYGVGVRRIIVVSDKPYTDKAEWFDEGQYPFSKKDVAEKIEERLSAGHSYNGKRNGWIYQQLLKLYTPFVIPSIASNVLILDADTIFLNKVNFIDADGAALYNFGTEYYKPYFEHAAKLIVDRPIRKVFHKYSGICHHMLFQRPVLVDLFNDMRNTHNKEPWQVLLECINPDFLATSCMSEYEIYFNYIFSRNYKVKIRQLTWENSRFSSDRIICAQMNGFHYISCHTHMS